MEDLKAQKKIIDLGKTIVKELELDPGVDTLAKWMAHYVAEKIELAEKLSGEEEARAKAECSEAILKLWEHTGTKSGGKRLIDDFEPLFETLEKLSPEKQNPFFYPTYLQDDLEKESKETHSKEAKCHLDNALRVDKLARSLILYELNQAVAKMELKGERSDSFKDAIDLLEYHATKIVRRVANDNKFFKTQEVEESNDTVGILKKRIEELEEFTSISNSLRKAYVLELSELDN